MSDRAALARMATLAAFGLLALVLLAWHWTQLSTAAAVVATLGTVAPLLLPAPGLVAGRRRTYRWAPLTLAPALTWALMELVANAPSRPFALAAGGLAFAALAAAVAWLRAAPPAQ